MPMASILDAVVREFESEENKDVNMDVFVTYRSDMDYMKPGARVRIGHIAPKFFGDAMKIVAAYPNMSRVCLTDGKFDMRGIANGDAPRMEISDLAYDMVRSHLCCGKPVGGATIDDCFARMRGGKCNDPMMARIAAMMTWEKGQGK